MMMVVVVVVVVVVGRRDLQQPGRRTLERPYFPCIIIPNGLIHEQTDYSFFLPEWISISCGCHPLFLPFSASYLSTKLKLSIHTSKNYMTI
jgi:hypothetical protein